MRGDVNGSRCTFGYLLLLCAILPRSTPQTSNNSKYTIKVQPLQIICPLYFIYSPRNYYLVLHSRVAYRYYPIVVYRGVSPGSLPRTPCL